MKNQMGLASHSDNSFDFLRVLAAMAVLYSHSYALYGRAEPLPVAGHSFGSLAVALFFAISGFLVCQSWVRDRSVRRFVIRRALRIFPGLLVCAAVTALVIGPAFTTLSAAEYFRSGTAWNYIWHAGLALDSPLLQGVFEHNPRSAMPNGSLWTLRYEILMYLLLAALGRVLPQARLKLACILCFMVFGGIWLTLMLGDLTPQKLPFLWRLGTDLYAERIAYLGAFFFSGACMYLYFEKIRLTGFAAVLMVAVTCIADNDVLAMLLLWLVAPYAALVFAFKAPAPFRKTNGFDYSYGIYIYAYPVQQALSLLGIKNGLAWSTVLMLSALVTVILAGLSWHLVEKPALSLKKALTPVLAVRSPSAADPQSRAA